MDATPAEINPRDLRSRLDAGEAFFVVDVRNPDEHAVGSIPEATLIPLLDLPGRLQELPSDRPIVVHCKMGGRSAQAQAFLLQQGFEGVMNLTGGLQAWAEQVDPTVRIA